MTTGTRQPFVHDAITCVHAPVTVLSPPDGQVRGGAHGYYHADTRWISRLTVTLDGAEPEPVDAQLLQAGQARFLAVHRSADDPGADPITTVERLRGADRDIERITVTNHGRARRSLVLRVTAACDLADMSAVRAGRPVPELPASATPAGDGLRWTDPQTGTVVTLGCDSRPERIDAAAGAMSWEVALEPGQSWTQRLTVGTAPGPRVPADPVAPATAVPWSDVTVRCADPRLPGLVARSLDDLAGLLLSDPRDRADHFLAAGAPWYLTLFGRDALWAARMLLPLGTDLAGGTLRALARRQGAADDPDTEEQPGKIPHELRRESTAPAGGLVLPPLYYGTIDATLLFVILLAEAWRWGMPRPEVEALVPHAERALGWLRDHADPDGDGFVEYRRIRGQGLANQGWKDSVDGVQSAKGDLARPPIALAEVQGYAYQAALAGADLLDAFGRDGADRWRAWAADLARRFRSAFWAQDAAGPYVAIALDGDKRPVDAVSSNPGHLLATGILDADECALVAARLADPGMDSGWGLRTMSARSAGFNPLGYHTGSVWAHDTAIAVAGLAQTGHSQAAATLLDGLLDAADAFDHRLPELHAGHQRAPGTRPVPYPAACRPQAWAAAAGISLLATLLGLRPDLPAGRLAIRPLPGSRISGLDVSGIRLGHARVTVTVDPAGHPRITGAPTDLHIDV